jgi:hypothetical protein
VRPQQFQRARKQEQAEDCERSCLVRQRVLHRASQIGYLRLRNFLATTNPPTATAISPMVAGSGARTETPANAAPARQHWTKAKYAARLNRFTGGSFDGYRRRLIAMKQFSCREDECNFANELLPLPIGGMRGL